MFVLCIARVGYYGGVVLLVFILVGDVVFVYDFVFI